MSSKTFVSLIAVSKENQVEDKASLKDQLKNSRNFGESMGWTFVKDFSIEGYSRSGYYDLSKAFSEIPELGNMAREIQSGIADMIIVDSFDRLGSLGLTLYEWLKPLRVQLRSVQQPTPFYNPDDYDWHKDNGTYKMIVMSLLDQDYRIGKLIRAFKIGTEKRVHDGYFARRVPFGYLRKDKYNVELNPSAAELLRQFPGWFLSGKSIHKICELANASGVKSSHGGRWNPSPVINILKSPFYCGKVFYERGTRKDGVYKPHPVYEVFDGKHEPIWSYETHLKILDEFKRRSVSPAQKRNQNLSGVIRCGVCNHFLWVAYDSSKNKDRRRYWMCPNKHMYVSAKKTEKLVAEALARLFASDAPVPNPEAPSATDYAERELSALRRQMSRLEQAYESGAYTVEEFTQKRKAYKAREAELKDAERQKAEAERKAAERVETVLRMRDLIPVLPVWLTETDPAEVRYHLARTVSVVMFPDKTVKVELL